MWFRDILTAQVEYLERERMRIENQLQVLPKEKLIKKHAKGRRYYYIQKGKKLCSLRKDTELINKYLLKENLQRQLAAIERNIPMLQRTIKSYRTISVLNSNWESVEDQQNRFYEDHKVHVYQGVNYGSKSEMLIAMALTSYGIEFEYETKMYVKGRYIYPDFLIKRPKDGKLFIWEHFGRMQEDEYRHKNLNRIEEYHQVGYYLWDNLIASFDLGKNSINMDYIDKIIKLYLL